MSNAFWYISLTVICLVLAIFTIYKKKNVSLLILFFFLSTGISFYCEYFVLVIFEAYRYIPGILKDSYADNVLGHIISNFIALPSIGILVLGYKFKWKGIFILSTTFMLIDYFFVKLNIYIHNWWRSYMTFMILIPYLFGLKYWKKLLEEKPKSIASSISYHLTAFALLVLNLFTNTIVLQKIRFSVGGGYSPLNGNTIFYPIYASLLALIYLIFVCHFAGRLWIIVPLLLNEVLNFILFKLNILHYLEDWKWYYLTFSDMLTLTIFILIVEKNKDKVICSKWF